MLHLKKRQKAELTRFAEYMVSGGAYFWSGYFIIVFMTPVIGLWWANLLGNAVGVTINFLLNRYWVFKSKKQSQLGGASAKYIIFTAANFVINYYILLGLQSAGVPVAIGQFIAAGFFTIWNYIWYKAWVFKGKEVHKRIRHHA